ncbi:hypothetical protein G6F46_010035 [Rhizopus delemar]|nr:hypothetical protein G6F55_011976 [Rhizopus delemar]KAG1534059.1 hypothetical protein G6F51_012301 [Rhizopus arrhizus]KAG1488390.1 hypothetical protein G6F54_012100 [Rhizopus delemar]KAG1506390.1 hypothetical protein G6F53_009724 [Rhizopus delemar]KAG1521785.1 hypothetical protein G6F52_006429 [Rhizopus delemar]
MANDLPSSHNSLLLNCCIYGTLPPEADNEGNIEYKLKLINPTDERLEHLVTQMKWRLAEGNGEAVYEIGIDDDGTIKGLDEDELNCSLMNLRKMANSLNADISSTKEINLSQLNLNHSTVQKSQDRKVAEVVIKTRLTDEEEGQHFTDLRIVLVGALGAGKSTLLGHICHGAKDNGRGKARLNLMRHRHELESGRSSSISHEIIGYDSEGTLINYATTNVSTWEQICESSLKIVTFLDTCGFPKYLRTTMSGLMGYAPDYACLAIAGNAGTVSGMTKEHLSIAVMLDLPVFVVITKSDTASQSQLTNTLCSLLSVLKSSWVNKVPVVVRNENDLIHCTSQFSRRGPELPIFMVSNVTGSNIDLLLKFIHHLPQPIKMGFDELLEESIEFHIEDVYSLPDVGVVVGGVLVQGRINVKENKWYCLGPNSKGKFTKVQVTSIHRHRIPAHYVHCGQAATLALTGVDVNDWKIHKGMVLLDTNDPHSFIEFEAEIMVLYHEVGISAGTRGMIHSGSIQQHAQVISIDPVGIRPIDDSTEESSSLSTDTLAIPSGYRGKCIFRFVHEPCYLRVGARVLFMEGISKCLGKVSRLVYH